MTLDFEIAPQELWRADQTFEEALLYCLFLEHNGRGWRLPHSYGWTRTKESLFKYDSNLSEKDDDTYSKDEEDVLVQFMYGQKEQYQFWVDTDHSSIFRNDQFCTIPVRSINGGGYAQ